MADTYEVELKFRLSDFDRILTELHRQGAHFVEEQHQVDQYFAHPLRDFGVTDEALRIRTLGEKNRLTYKGPVLTGEVLDQRTKTRREIELSFQEGLTSAQEFAKIWETLGFRRVRIVEKTRKIYSLRLAEREFEICLDQVSGLGAYLEIETLATKEQKCQSQADLNQLAQDWGLGEPEHRSYLEMLMESDQSQNV